MTTEANERLKVVSETGPCGCDGSECGTTTAMAEAVSEKAVADTSKAGEDCGCGCGCS